MTSCKPKKPHFRHSVCTSLGHPKQTNFPARHRVSQLSLTLFSIHAPHSLTKDFLRWTFNRRRAPSGRTPVSPPEQVSISNDSPSPATAPCEIRFRTTHRCFGDIVIIIIKELYGYGSTNRPISRGHQWHWPPRFRFNVDVFGYDVTARRMNR